MHKVECTPFECPDEFSNWVLRLGTTSPSLKPASFFHRPSEKAGYVYFDTNSVTAKELHDFQQKHHQQEFEGKILSIKVLAVTATAASMPWRRGYMESPVSEIAEPHRGPPVSEKSTIDSRHDHPQSLQRGLSDQLIVSHVTNIRDVQMVQSIVSNPKFALSSLVYHIGCNGGLHGAIRLKFSSEHAIEALSLLKEEDFDAEVRNLPSKNSSSFTMAGSTTTKDNGDTRTRGGNVDTDKEGGSFNMSDLMEQLKEEGVPLLGRVSEFD